MDNILYFNLFVESFFSSFEYDKLAKDTFTKMLNNIDKMDVRKFADYRREATIKFEEEKKDSKTDVESQNKQDKFKKRIDEVEDEVEDEFSVREDEVEDEFSVREDVDPNYRIKKRGLKNPERTEITSKKETDFKSLNKPKSKNIDIAVIKNYSKHRTSSKIWGNRKENDYSLAINGKHLISDIRGQEGKTLVSPKIIQIFWSFLSELSEIQDKYKRGLIDESEYDSAISGVKSKYTGKIK